MCGRRGAGRLGGARGQVRRASRGLSKLVPVDADDRELLQFQALHLIHPPPPPHPPAHPPTHTRPPLHCPLGLLQHETGAALQHETGAAE